MPDVNQIIATYKEACRQKELDKQAEIERRKQQRAMNAEAIEECIKTVIEPVFEDAKAQILKNGFPCQVNFISRKDDAFSGTRTFGIGIMILTQSKPEEYRTSKYHLQYEGSFEAQEITKSEGIPKTGKAADKYPPVALSQISREMVDTDLEEFLLKVFKV